MSAFRKEMGINVLFVGGNADLYFVVTVRLFVVLCGGEMVVFYRDLYVREKCY